MRARAQPVHSGAVWPSRAWLWASVLALCAATIHAGQSTVFFDGVPGDLGDARLVNCILEHLYQWGCGHAKLYSPAQFYPVAGTLAYSDNHFGTALIYVVFRVMGASIETAFQGWLLVVIAANAGALLYLLHRLEVSPMIAAPLAFFGSSSSALVFKAGHPQVLPFFAFIFAFSFLLQFLRKADAKSLGWAILWFGYQHACYMYHGFFALGIFGTVVVAFLALCARRPWWSAVLISVRGHWRWLVFAIVLTTVLLVFLYYPYVRFAASTGTRPWQELNVLAPNPGAWFSASPFSVFYAKQRFYKPGANVIESTLFAGWLIWPLLLVALAFAFRQRDNPPGLKLAGILALAVIVLMAGLTTWSGNRGNLYLLLAEQIPQVRAFRAFTRIAYPLIVVESVAAALLLNALYHDSSTRWLRGAAIGLAFALAIENLAIGQVHYSKSIARLRGAAMVKMWKRAGGHDVLVFAPGYTNQPAAFIHTDCWYAALKLHKWALNGYSGNVPRLFAPFLASPTVKNAKALLSHYDLPPERISLVTDWEPAARARLGIVSYQLPQPILPLAAISQLTLAPGVETEISVTLEFRGTTKLPCDQLHIFASYRVYDAAGKLVAHPQPLRTSVHSLRPGTSPLTMRIVAPRPPGEYQVQLSMIQEGVAWWADMGLAGSTIRLSVTAGTKP